MTAIDLRFTGDERVLGDESGAWATGVDAALRPTGACVDAIDLCGVTRPRAVRAVADQRMTRLQLALLRRPQLRRVLVVALTGEGCDEARACAGFAAAAASVHRRVETRRGSPLAIAVLVVPARTDAARLRRCVLAGAPAVPDGAAAVTWAEAEEWGIRAAVSLQTL